jgi:CrcB protein
MKVLSNQATFMLATSWPQTAQDAVFYAMIYSGEGEPMQDRDSLLWLWVGLAGVLGAFTRFAVSQLPIFADGEVSFPYATLVCNLLGSLLLARLLFSKSTLREERLRQMVGSGFLGAFTTFSAIGLEWFQLFQGGYILTAFSYVLLTSSGGLLCAWIGYRWALRAEAAN